MAAGYSYCSHASLRWAKTSLLEDYSKGSNDDDSDVVMIMTMMMIVMMMNDDDDDDDYSTLIHSMSGKLLDAMLRHSYVDRYAETILVLP